MEVSENQQTSIVKCFSVIPDPRSLRNQLHPLITIITTAIIGVVCGADDWLEVHAFAMAREEWLRRFLALENGVPSVDTFRRVFRYLDSRQFAECFADWMKEVTRLTKGKVIAIDGKRLNGAKEGAQKLSPLCIVSAFATQRGLVLGQLSADKKSNEITAIPLLLEMLDLKEATVTIDAAGCHRQVASIIRRKKGDYILALKGNQGHLHDEVTNYFDQAEALSFDGVPCDHYQSEERSRDRKEMREVYTTEDLDWLPQRTDWAGLKSIIMIRSKRSLGQKTTIERRYYISSLPANAWHLGEAIRGHWGIENKLHWVLDVAYREDASKIRKDHGPHNFAAIRRLTANLIRLTKEKNPKLKGGIKVLRKRAGWDESYLADLLNAN